MYLETCAVRGAQQDEHVLKDYFADVSKRTVVAIPKLLRMASARQLMTRRRELHEG